MLQKEDSLTGKRSGNFRRRSRRWGFLLRSEQDLEHGLSGQKCSCRAQITVQLARNTCRLTVSRGRALQKLVLRIAQTAVPVQSFRLAMGPVAAVDSSLSGRVCWLWFHRICERNSLILVSSSTFIAVRSRTGPVKVMRAALTFFCGARRNRAGTPAQGQRILAPEQGQNTNCRGLRPRPTEQRG